MAGVLFRGFALVFAAEIFVAFPAMSHHLDFWLSSELKIPAMPPILIQKPSAPIESEIVVDDVVF
jgi:hypothetical protein